MWQKKPVCINQEPDTPPYMWHDSHSHVLHHIFMHARHDAYSYMQSDIYSYVKKETCVYQPRARHPYICVTWLTFICTTWYTHTRYITQNPDSCATRHIHMSNRKPICINQEAGAPPSRPSSAPPLLPWLIPVGLTFSHITPTSKRCPIGRHGRRSPDTDFDIRGRVYYCWPLHDSNAVPQT